MAFKKGLRKNRVFVLDEEIVTGKVGMSTNTSSDRTILWHLRLEHIGEKGPKELDN